jgi:CheY-like chemotaxis protein
MSLPTLSLPLVLMIDDNTSDLTLAEMAFTEAGLQVDFRGMHRSEQAKEHLRDLAADAAAVLPRLILIDLNMPRVPGAELLAFLKTQPRLARIPVVVLTTSNSPVDRSRCLTLGAAEFQVKPFRLDAYLELIGTFRRYLDSDGPQTDRPAGDDDDGPGPSHPEGPAMGVGPQVIQSRLGHGLDFGRRRAA